MYDYEADAYARWAGARRFNAARPPAPARFGALQKARGVYAYAGLPLALGIKAR
jgi:hypothetical protein